MRVTKVGYRNKWGWVGVGILLALAFSFVLLVGEDNQTVVPQIRLAANPSATPLNSVTATPCAAPTIMNIVAHEDDDLLFMNPDLIHEIQSGDCIRTIYMTAGDGAGSKSYWIHREQGAEAAYAQMFGIANLWTQRTVKLSNHEYVTIAEPKATSRVSLVFMQLPDGNTNGQGFARARFESLAKLEKGSIVRLYTVDNQSWYTSVQLTNAIISLMNTYRPSAVNTQATFISAAYPDHSDHMNVGKIVTSAHVQYNTMNKLSIPLQFYIGYPVQQWPSNVTGNELQLKEITYLAYAKFDMQVCQTLQACQQAPGYGVYLTREYQGSH